MGWWGWGGFVVPIACLRLLLRGWQWLHEKHIKHMRPYQTSSFRQVVPPQKEDSGWRGFWPCPSSPKLIPTPQFLPPGYSLFPCVFAVRGEILKLGVGITFGVPVIKLCAWDQEAIDVLRLKDCTASRDVVSCHAIAVDFRNFIVFFRTETLAHWNPTSCQTNIHN